MNNTTLNQRLQQAQDLISNSAKAGWSAIDRDVALALLRTVYADLLQVELRQEKAPVQSSIVAEQSTPAPREVKPEETPLVNVVSAWPVVEPQEEVIEREADSVTENLVEETTSTIVQPEVIAVEASIPMQEKVDIVSQRSVDSAPAPILADRLLKPISDLRTGIPLNEKFGLIKNLFENNSTEYQDAILHLGRCTSRNELTYHFDEIARQRNWDMEEPNYVLLRSYVERRALYLDQTPAS